MIQENDLVWKEIVTLLLQDFTEFFWQEAYHAIDWTKPYESLEQELNQISIKDEIGRRYVDKLFKVFLKTGEEQWILLHIEIQHSKQEDFPKRMFTYFNRVFTKYNKDIASLAILADLDPNWRPKQYHRVVLNTTILRTYEVVKLIDYQGKEEQLKQSNNPFGIVVLAQLVALSTKYDQESRLISKTQLFRHLLTHKWDFEKIKNMCIFLDNLLALKDELEVKYIEQVKQIEEDNQMNLTLAAERFAFQDGVKSGFQDGEAQILMKLLKVKFKNVPDEYISKIKEADLVKLDNFAVNLLNAKNIDEVFN
jgi:hypothetical protein